MYFSSDEGGKKKKGEIFTHPSHKKGQFPSILFPLLDNRALRGKGIGPNFLKFSEGLRNFISFDSGILEKSGLPLSQEGERGRESASSYKKRRN